MCFDDGMPDVPSNAADKLQACLNHDWPDHDKDYPSGYIKACAAWFAALSNSDRMAAARAVAAINHGNETEALNIAAALPAAPKFPLF